VHPESDVDSFKGQKTQSTTNMPAPPVPPPVPLMPPLPPGYDPDRVDESHLAQILGVISAVHFLAIIIVALRFYVRIRVVKSVGWDDGTIAAATVCATHLCTYRRQHEKLTSGGY
jgi:hypothetical protein